MLFVGGLLELGGPLANVLDGQRRDDDKGFVKATVVLGFHQHPRHPRIHRNLGQLAADRRQFGVAGLGTSRDAPSSSRSPIPSFTARWSGGSTKGNAAMSPRPRAVICKITDARLVRRISGSVNAGRDSKSSSEYRRMQIPSATRPQRPER